MEVDGGNMNILGSIVKLSFPVVGDESFLAKVDTGADSSSIHCDDFYVKDDVLYCKILALKKILKFKNFSKKFVKSSNGEGSERYKVTLRVIVDGCEVVGKFTQNESSKDAIVLYSTTSPPSSIASLTIKFNGLPYLDM